MLGVKELLGVLGVVEDVIIGLFIGNIEVGVWLKFEYFGLMDYFLFGGFGDYYLVCDDVVCVVKSEVEKYFGMFLCGDLIWVVGDMFNDICCGKVIGVNVFVVGMGGVEFDMLCEY